MKYAYTFAAGAVAMLALFFGTGNQMPLAMFAAGVFVPVGIAGAVVIGPRRARRIARILETLASALEERKPAKAAKAAAQETPSEAETELVAALQGLGSQKAAARAAARHALSVAPRGTFQDQFRAALAFARS
jgi:hypothetical protein